MVIVIKLKIFYLRSSHNYHNPYQITLQLPYLLSLSFMGNQLHKVLQMIISYFYKFHKVLLLHLMYILLLVILMFILPVFIISLLYFPPLIYLPLLIPHAPLIPLTLHIIHSISHHFHYHFTYHFTYRFKHIKSPILHHFLIKCFIYLIYLNYRYHHYHHQCKT